MADTNLTYDESGNADDLFGSSDDEILFEGENNTENIDQSSGLEDQEANFVDDQGEEAVFQEEDEFESENNETAAEDSDTVVIENEEEAVTESAETVFEEIEAETEAGIETEDEIGTEAENETEIETETETDVEAEELPTFSDNLMIGNAQAVASPMYLSVEEGTIPASGYYGDLLTQGAKEIYDAMATSWVDGAEYSEDLVITPSGDYSFEVPEAISEQMLLDKDACEEYVQLREAMVNTIGAAMEALILDYPQLYWVGEYGAEIDLSGNRTDEKLSVVWTVEKITLRVQDAFLGARENFINFRNDINKEALQISEAASEEGVSGLTKALQEYMNTAFVIAPEDSISDSEGNSPYFAFYNGTGYDDGFVRLFKILCDQLNINNVIVINDNHITNAIFLNETWENVNLEMNHFLSEKETQEGDVADEDTGDKAVSSLKITKQPEDITVAQNGQATFSVEATGTGLTYQWQFQWPTDAEDQWRNFGSATNASLTRNVPANWDGLKIRCIVKDSSGSQVISDTATITIGIVITKQPESVTVAPNTQATFTVEAEGTNLSYQWQFQWATDAPDKWSNFGSAKAASLTRNIPSNWDGIKVRCVLKDGNGKEAISATAVIHVTSGLQITKHPENVTVQPNQQATFSVSAEGADLKYQWQFQWPTDSADTWRNFGSATSSSLTRNIPSNWDGLKVRCLVKDGTGAELPSNTALISVGDNFRITKQPESVVVEANHQATFSVTAEGTNVSYQWQFQWPTDAADKWSNFGSATSSTLTRNIPANWNGLKVHCIVKDGTGKQIISDTADITIGSGLVITKHPESVTVAPNHQAMFTVTAQGTNLKYQWQFQWAHESGEKWSNFGSATANTLARNIPANWNGLKVRCVVSDGNGEQKTSSIAVVTVMEEDDIVIIKQPDNVTVKANAQATFEIQAQGTNLSYQWQFQWPNKDAWNNFGSATAATLTRSIPQNWDGLKVRCIVRNNSKEVISEAATITIDNATVIDGVVYELISGRMMVTGFIGTPVNVVVQEVVDGKNVVEIADEAFYQRTTLESIDLPDTIEVIGVRAFAECTNLSNMY